jgi:hypothetical protein
MAPPGKSQLPAAVWTRLYRCVSRVSCHVEPGAACARSVCFALRVASLPTPPPVLVEPTVACGAGACPRVALWGLRMDGGVHACVRTSFARLPTQVPGAVPAAARGGGAGHARILPPANGGSGPQTLPAGVCVWGEPTPPFLPPALPVHSRCPCRDRVCICWSRAPAPRFTAHPRRRELCVLVSPRMRLVKQPPLWGAPWTAPPHTRAPLHTRAPPHTRALPHTLAPPPCRTTGVRRRTYAPAWETSSSGRRTPLAAGGGRASPAATLRIWCTTSCEPCG